MDKQELINAIALDLVQLYTPFTYGQGADMTIEATFTEGKRSDGGTKVTFLASILINEAEGTVYYWEQSKTQKSGISLNSYQEDASSVASQKIVTSQIYDPNGNLIEGQLYVNQIGKAVKARAQQHGWVFKTVLQKSKASYPIGGISPLTSPSFTAQGPVVSKGSQATPVGAGKLFWILNGILILFALVVGFVGKVSLLGMALILCIALILFFLGSKGMIKGVALTLGTWVLTAIVLVFVIGFYAPSDDHASTTQTAGAGGTVNEQNSTTPVASKDEVPMFAITGIRTSSMATAESRVVNGESEYRPFAVFTSFLDLQSMGPVGEDASDMKKLKVYNFKVTSPPSKGKVSYFVEFVPQNTDYTDYTSLDAYEYELEATTYMSSMSITLHTMITEVSDYFTLNQSTISSDEILGKVATWEELKFIFECDIEVISETGDRYVKHVVVELPQGDFIMNPTDQSYSEIKMDLVNDLGSALFIKQ